MIKLYSWVFFTVPNSKVHSRIQLDHSRWWSTSCQWQRSITYNTNNTITIENSIWNSPLPWSKRSSITFWSFSADSREPAKCIYDLCGNSMTSSLKKIMIHRKISTDRNTWLQTKSQVEAKSHISVQIYVRRHLTNVHTDSLHCCVIENNLNFRLLKQRYRNFHCSLEIGHFFWRK